MFQYIPIKISYWENIENIPIFIYSGHTLMVNAEEFGMSKTTLGNADFVSMLSPLQKMHFYTAYFWFC